MNSPAPVMGVETDNSRVQSLIQTTARILLDNGATVNPNLTICESDGHLSVHYPRDASGETLFVIPQELLIPTSEIIWGVATDTRTGKPIITIDSAQSLTTVQRELLNLYVDLYNTLNKFEWFLTEHPRSALFEYPDVESLFMKCEPNFSRGHNVEDFLATRTLGYRDKSADSEAQTKRPVLMPLADLINHHKRGAALDTGNGALTILAVKGDGTSECFVSYGGQRDALQMYSHYGFADNSCTTATSTPATITLAGHSSQDLGTLVIERKHIIGHLPLVTSSGTTLTLNKATFTPKNLDRFNASFTLPVKSFALQHGASITLADQIAQKAARDLIEFNQQQLGELLETVVALETEQEVINELEVALRVQLRTLDKFSQHQFAE